METTKYTARFFDSDSLEGVLFMTMPEITITKEQFDATVDAFDCSVQQADEVGFFDTLLLDERTPEGCIVTVTLYDDESILLQKINEKGDLQYIIVPDCEYWSGAYIES